MKAEPDPEEYWQAVLEERAEAHARKQELREWHYPDDYRPPREPPQ